MYTDHEPLKYIYVQPHLNARQARWLEQLAELDLNIVYNFSLDKNKILRLQVTLDSPHAKNVSISQTALFLFRYTRMKFPSFLTQRLSFCSTNFVKVQVS